eukprot:GHVU01096540.1.p2 GENE.GHVU01096540.1~~GHVU01096540.1.p2  ORF type:complete len:102 (-),score=16.99 GHVU01096540.1:397-702(-)
MSRGAEKREESSKGDNEAPPRTPNRVPAAAPIGRRQQEQKKMDTEKATKVTLRKHIRGYYAAIPTQSPPPSAMMRHYYSKEEKEQPILYFQRKSNNRFIPI